MSIRFFRLSLLQLTHRSISFDQFMVEFLLLSFHGGIFSSIVAEKEDKCSLQRSFFHLSSFSATMEEKIPPWKDRRRNSTVNWSNEIDRWVSWRRDRRKKRMDTYVYMLHTYNILRTSLRVVYYTTNVFTRSICTCKYYINLCLVPW